MESLKMVKITRVMEEADRIKTFLFNHVFERPPKPGQFLMVWLPGVDEIPLALSHHLVNDTTECGVTIAEVGDTTAGFHKLSKGDLIGVRGPYGNGFTFSDAERILVVGGGIGMAPLAMAVETALAEGKKVQAACGARTESELLFAERVRRACGEILISTDDGSAGTKGFVTSLAEEMMQKNSFDLVLGCGPEPMLAALLDICSKKELALQISLERYMKCGIGICDSCAISGMHVCRDGPVLTGEQVAELSDFGKFKRDPSGRKISI